jgi:hypothetical protein
MNHARPLRLDDARPIVLYAQAKAVSLACENDGNVATCGEGTVDGKRIDLTAVSHHAMGRHHGHH